MFSLKFIYRLENHSGKQKKTQEGVQFQRVSKRNDLMDSYRVIISNVICNVIGVPMYYDTPYIPRPTQYPIFIASLRVLKKKIGQLY